jgi:immune inhibitor A
MTRQLSVPASPATLNMRLNYQIESGWDYAYVQVSNDNGGSWTNLAGTYLNTTGGQSNLTTTVNTNGQNLGNGITGSTANATNAPNGWRLASFNLDAYAGQNVLLRIRYKTDNFTTLNGILVDEISVNGTPVDNAENGANGWTLNGFKTTTGREPSNAPHYYIAEFRQYRTYDEGLKTGPYAFGFNAPYNNKVAHFPYQDGLLITYWDTTQANNNTSQHPGEGRSLPIDAHPQPLTRTGLPMGGTNWNFAPWGSRYQMYDATFGLEDTDPISLPFRGTLPGAINDPACVPNGANSTCEFMVQIPSQAGNPVFDDSNPYWFVSTAASGVIVPITGTKIRVVNTSAQGTMMQIHVN